MAWPQVAAFVILTFIFQMFALIAAVVLKKSNEDFQFENSSMDEI